MKDSGWAGSGCVEAPCVKGSWEGGSWEGGSCVEEGGCEGGAWLSPTVRAQHVFLATSKVVMQLKRRELEVRVGDLADNGPGRCYSPRHRVPLDSKYQSLKCVPMKWQPISPRPYPR